jgi:prepilin-type N-terminal cleavage/methylation domain-containing protein
MRWTPRRNRRAAFTIIELLIVMGIIAVIASLSIGAVFSLRESQLKNATETTMQKLSSALDQQIKATMDQIYEETPAGSAMTLANNDLRRGRVIYTKLRLAKEFPVTFDQVRGHTPFLPLPTDIGRKEAYFQVITGGADATTNYPKFDWESSALLYLALKQGRRGQAAFDAATLVEPAAIQTRSDGTTTYQVFVDAWGNPLRFYMFPFDNDELNVPGSPYSVTTTTGNSADTVDPEGTLMIPSWRLNGSAPSANAQLFARYCHRLPSPSDPNPSVAANPNNARVLLAVVASTGKDGAWGLDDTPLTSPFMRVTSYDQQTDNIYSYRLRRFGNRGD